MEEKIRYIEEKLKTFPRTPLSIVPTPCHRLHTLSEAYGADLYCKRDDMTGFGFGGNKSRKLEFLIGEAIEHNSDTLVTCGGIQSNFCRLTAAAGAFVGMDVHLVLGGGRPDEATGNVILDQLLGAKIHYMESTDWNEWEEEAGRLARQLQDKGKKVFRIPIGGSVPVGVAGYTAVFLEILNDQKRLGMTFDHIIHASGSGGTQAGLVVGKEMSEWKGRISGISVSMEKKILEKTVFQLALETAAMLGGKASRESVIVYDGFVGEGYAIRTTRAESAIELFARREGVFLDHVYTGKAAGALIEWLEKGELSGKKVLFLHTGGQTELFAKP